MSEDARLDEAYKVLRAEDYTWPPEIRDLRKAKAILAIADKYASKPANGA